MDTYWDGEIEVCMDCFFAHHYGAHQRFEGGLWYAGDSDTPADVQPLLRCDGLDLADATNGETGEGITTFSAWPCEGCGSLLAGSRYTLVYKVLVKV